MVWVIWLVYIPLFSWCRISRAKNWTLGDWIPATQDIHSTRSKTQRLSHGRWKVAGWIMLDPSTAITGWWGGAITTLKHMSSSMGRIIPNWMEKWNSCSKPPTRFKILPTAPCFLTDLRSRCPKSWSHSRATSNIRWCIPLGKKKKSQLRAIASGQRSPIFTLWQGQLRDDLPPLYIYIYIHYIYIYTYYIHYISIIYIYIHYIYPLLCYLGRLALWTSNIVQKQKSAHLNQENQNQ